MKSLNILFFSLIFLSFFGCGKGGGPGAPSLSTSATPAMSPDIPQETAMMGAIQAFGASTGSGVFSISIEDEKGVEILQGQSDESGNIQLKTLLRGQDSGFYRVRVFREGDPDLETTVPIEAGQKGNEFPIEATPATTLAIRLGKALGADSPEQFLFLVPLFKSLDQRLIEDALFELNKFALEDEFDLETFLGGTNALHQVLDEIMPRIISATR